MLWDDNGCMDKICFNREVIVIQDSDEKTSHAAGWCWLNECLQLAHKILEFDIEFEGKKYHAVLTEVD